MTIKINPNKPPTDTRAVEACQIELPWKEVGDGVQEGIECFRLAEGHTLVPLTDDWCICLPEPNENEIICIYDDENRCIDFTCFAKVYCADFVSFFLRYEGEHGLHVFACFASLQALKNKILTPYTMDKRLFKVLNRFWDGECRFLGNQFDRLNYQSKSAVGKVLSKIKKICGVSLLTMAFFAVISLASIGIGDLVANWDAYIPEKYQNKSSEIETITADMLEVPSSNITIHDTLKMSTIKWNNGDEIFIYAVESGISHYFQRISDYRYTKTALNKTYSYPALFYYSKQDDRSEILTQGSCNRFEIVDNLLYYCDYPFIEQKKAGNLYLFHLGNQSIAPDKQLLMEDVQEFTIVDGAIYFILSTESRYHYLTQKYTNIHFNDLKGVWRMDLDGKNVAFVTRDVSDYF